MLGWWIRIEQQSDSEYSGEENVIASWEVCVSGIDWIDTLVEEGKAEVISKNGGYPDKYAAYPQDILPYVTTVSAADNGSRVQTRDRSDYAGPVIFGSRHVRWMTVMRFDYERLAAAAPEEKLLIVVWDLS